MIIRGTSELLISDESRIHRRRRSILHYIMSHGVHTKKNIQQGEGEGEGEGTLCGSKCTERHSKECRQELLGECANETVNRGSTNKRNSLNNKQAVLRKSKSASAGSTKETSEMGSDGADCNKDKFN
jgi:hypothetical protein